MLRLFKRRAGALETAEKSPGREEVLTPPESVRSS